MGEKTVFEQYQVTAWQVGPSRKLAFPIKTITETGGNRLVKRERPYREGAKFDDTGSKDKGWVIEAVFENSIEEEGLDSTIPIYPTLLNELIDSFVYHQTGDLYLPTRGRVRARLESYSRKEGDEAKDYAELTLTFCEDNEDNVGASSFNLPTVQASAKRITELTEFTAQSEGMWSGSLADLRALGAEIEAIANYPGDSFAQLDEQASIIVSTVNRTTRGWQRGTKRTEALIMDPELSRTQRKLEETKDLVRRAIADAGKGRSKMVPFMVTNPTDIYSLAAQHGQNVQDLIAVNSGIDLLHIPANTVIRMFE